MTQVLNNELRSYIEGMLNINLNLNLNEIVNPLIKDLIENGANPNLFIVKNELVIPLIAIILRDNDRQRIVSTTRFLLSKGLDLSGIGIVGNINTTPLMWIIEDPILSQDISFIKTLLKAGANTTINTEINGYNALSLALLMENYPLIEIVLKNGANPNLQVVQKIIPLIENPDFLDELIDSGFYLSNPFYIQNSNHLLHLLQISIQRTITNLETISDFRPEFKTNLQSYLPILRKMTTILSTEKNISYNEYRILYNNYRQIKRDTNRIIALVHDDTMFS